MEYNVYEELAIVKKEIKKQKAIDAAKKWVKENPERRKAYREKWYKENGKEYYKKYYAKHRRITEKGYLRAKRIVEKYEKQLMAQQKGEASGNS